MPRSREEELAKRAAYARSIQPRRTIYMREYRRRRIPEMRHEIVDLLGGKCANCGIDDFRVLVIDHRFGGGGGHRKRTSTIHYLREVLNNLDGFRILCHNCNHLARLPDFADRVQVPIVE